MRLQSSASEGAADLLLDGRGPAWQSRSLIADELADSRVVVAGDAPWAQAVEIRLYRQQAALAPVAEKFWRAVSAAQL